MFLIGMFRAKVFAILVFAAIATVACFDSGPQNYSIAQSKELEASLFRQNCAICHGLEGDGKTLDDGTVVPSLRHGRDGEFKFRTESEIYNQIANGGNGMSPFRGQLSDREIRLLTGLVHNKLRK